MSAAVLFQDDYVLRYVDQAPGQVAAVCCPQGRVSQTFSRSVRGDEVFQNTQPFPEAAADRQVDDSAGGVAHQAAHTGHLADLGDITFGAARCHQVHRAVAVEAILDRRLDLFGGVAPDRDRSVVSLLLCDQPTVELVLDLGDPPICLFQ